MPVVDMTGAVIVEGGEAFMPLQAFLEAAERPDAVLMAPESSPEQLAPYLDRLRVIAIAFPKFRDGRGFTIAHALRFKHGYKGELRATGHVIPDQFSMLHDCGFTAIQTPPEHPPEQWTQIAAERAKPHPSQLFNRLVARTR